MTKEIQNKLDAADRAFHEWKTVSFGDRKKLSKKLAKLLEKNSSKLAEIITKEMGKPIPQSVAEIEKCALMTRYYANAENVLKPEQAEPQPRLSATHYAPQSFSPTVMPSNL